MSLVQSAVKIVSVRYSPICSLIKKLLPVSLKQKIREVYGRITGRNYFYPEMPLTHEYCVGAGLEIGGSAQNPFGLNTKNVDLFETDSVFKKEELKQAGWVLPVDILASGDDIPVPDNSQDFVISSHVLEHMPNVIKALKEWDRVVRIGGIIFMIIPHKERTFDSHLPRTPLSHIIVDYENDVSELYNTDGSPLGHQHVWVTEDLLEIIKYLNRKGLLRWKIEEVEDVDSKVGNGFTIVCRKVSQTMKDPWQLSVIIVNWNTKEQLLDCLKSISKNIDISRIEVEVVVVDNNSSDGSIEAVEKYFPQVILLANKENKGLAAAWNQGIKASKGEFVVLLNPDIKIKPNCLENLVEFLEYRPDVGVVGPKLINSEGQDGNYGYYAKFPTLLQFILFRTPLYKITLKSAFLKRTFMGVFDSELSQEVDQPPGAFFMVKRAVLDKVGLADERFFLYYEDVDLAKRIKKAGYKNFYVAEAEAVHHGEGSTRKLFEYTQRYYFYSSACKYFCKHFNRFYGFLVMLVSQGCMYLRLLSSFRKREVNRMVVKGYINSSKELLLNWRY